MRTRIYTIKNHIIKPIKVKKPEYAYANYFCKKEGLYIYYSKEAMIDAYDSIKTTPAGLFIPIMLEKAYDFHGFCEAYMDRNMVFLATQKTLENSEVPQRILIKKANKLPSLETEIELPIGERLCIAIPREHQILGSRKISIKYGVDGNYILVEKGISNITSKELEEYYGQRFHYLYNYDYSYEESSIRSEHEIKLPYNFHKSLKLKTDDAVRFLAGENWFAIVPSDKKCDITGERISSEKSGAINIKCCATCKKQKKDLKEIAKTANRIYKSENKVKKIESDLEKLKEAANGKICIKR